MGVSIVCGEYQGEGVRRDATDGRVSAEVVVFVAPVVVEETGFGEGTAATLRVNDAGRANRPSAAEAANHANVAARVR